ncbi:MAG: hypothetical protein OXI88_01135 [Gammaproteobacteria bacterium]|nr:hypothetical protein [Gammaproteobacteria bacterium]MDE0510380.1 hypothetical protein [Gammaproteobacteria bacterium]
MNTRVEFVGLLASILVAALLLHNTLDDSIDVLRQDVRELQTRVTNIEVKVAGIESKLDLLIDAWDIDVPESLSIAAK